MFTFKTPMVCWMSLHIFAFDHLCSIDGNVYRFSPRIFWLILDLPLCRHLSSNVTSWDVWWIFFMLCRICSHHSAVRLDNAVHDQSFMDSVHDEIWTKFVHLSWLSLFVWSFPSSHQTRISFVAILADGHRRAVLSTLSCL